MTALSPQDHDLLVVINNHYVKSKQHYEVNGRDDHFNTSIPRSLFSEPLPLGCKLR